MAYSTRKAVAGTLAPQRRTGVSRPPNAVSRQQRLAAVQALGRLALPIADVATLNREATAEPKKLLP